MNLALGADPRGRCGAADASCRINVTSCLNRRRHGMSGGSAIAMLKIIGAVKVFRSSPARGTAADSVYSSKRYDQTACGAYKPADD